MANILSLSNGVKVVLEKMPYVRSVSFGLWVKNGSRHEDDNTNGISHFIEHMLFKGTENRTARDIADEMDSIGGQINAYTSKESTCYYTKTLDTHFDSALDILADMFFNSKFDEEEIQKEKNVIAEEISMYEDTPDDVVHEILHSSIWEKCPLGYPIIGTEKNIRSFNHNTFKDYYSKSYIPQNTVIAVAGNIDDEVIKKLESYFGGFSVKVNHKNSSNLTQYRNCLVTKEKDIEQLHITVGFPGLTLNSEDIYTMSVLNTIFGGGMSSRLFQKIREEHGLAYSVYSSHYTYEDAGLFSIYAGLNKNNAADVLNHIVDEIKRLHTDKISLKQLDRTKEQIKSSYLLSLESSSSRMSSIGRSTLMLNRVLTSDQIISKIEEITIDRLYDVINTVLNLDNISLSVVGDIQGLDFKGMLNNAI